MAGELMPGCSGVRAMTNFGVAALAGVLGGEWRLGRLPDESARGRDGHTRQPNQFSGFVFKIQANMNPRHRDRIAFMRVVSGQFERGMDVKIGRSAEALRLSKPHSFMAQERSIVEEAWPGDIVGLYDPGKLRIGDTLSAGDVIQYKGIPRFAPEHFARLRLKDPLRRKQLASGLDQLSKEGAIQLFFRPEFGQQDPYLGAVGMLQYEVLIERLKNEYRVEAILEMTNFRLARWIGETRRAWSGSSPAGTTPSFTTAQANPSYLRRALGRYNTRCEKTQAWNSLT